MNSFKQSGFLRRYTYLCCADMDDVLTPLNKALLNTLGEAIEENLRLAQQLVEKEQHRGVCLLACVLNRAQIGAT